MWCLTPVSATVAVLFIIPKKTPQTDVGAAFKFSLVAELLWRHCSSPPKQIRHPQSHQIPRSTEKMYFLHGEECSLALLSPLICMSPPPRCGEGTESSGPNHWPKWGAGGGEGCAGTRAEGFSSPPGACAATLLGKVWPGRRRTATGWVPRWHPPSGW